MPNIKIGSIAKVQQKSENLFGITHSLSAEEIFAVIRFLSSDHCTLSYLYAQAFLHDPKHSFEVSFACRNMELTNNEFLQVLTHGANNGSLESFLALQSDETLQNLLTAAGLAPSSQNKEDLTKEFVKKPEALIGTDIAVNFTKMNCIDLGPLYHDNRYIGYGTSTLVFGMSKKKEFLPQSTSQFWRIFPSSPSSAVDDSMCEPSGVDFFRVTSSNIQDGVCTLNLKESDAEEVLKEYVEQNRANAQKFDAQSIFLETDRELVDEYKSRSELFIVQWPNSQKGLTDKFGQAKKTKFETLKFGLSLLDHLEPTRKLISAFVDKKIYLLLDTWELPFIGILIEKNILEVLILHLKLEYLSGAIAVCRVQEKVTDEVLNVIWERTENNRMNNARFSATQLTD